MKSLRAYLVTRLLLGAGLVLALGGVGVYLAVSSSLQSQFDQNLTDRVQGFASILFQQGQELSFEFSGELMPEYERLERPSYFQLWLDDGRVIERSESLNDEEAPPEETVDLAVPGELDVTPRHWSAPLPDGRPGRYVGQILAVHHVYPEEGPDRPVAARVRVVVARGTERLVAAKTRVMAACLAASLGLLALIGLVVAFAVRRGLEPARRLARVIDSLRVDHLPRAIDAGELPVELRPIMEKTNALIGRVESALDRERRTTADIAHELRTPISEMLTVSEVALHEESGGDEMRSSLSTVRDIAWRMGRSVTTLLKLARIEMGAETNEPAAVDLGELSHELWTTLGAVRRERGLHVENHVARGEVVDGDPDVLRIIVSNLQTNALHHAAVGGEVETRLERPGDGWRWTVENESRGLADEDLERLSEPFWRKDRARADRAHSGLGLALSRALAQQTGLRLEFELEGQRFRAVLGRWEDLAASNGHPAGNGRS